MANGRTHMIVGTGVALAADFFWQRKRMADDPDRKFDWGELAGVGLFGGFFGLLADLLEPATSPNHRGFFHSLFWIGLVVWALGKWGCKLTALGLGFAVIMVGCYFSHLFLDALTPRGLPFIGRWRC